MTEKCGQCGGVLAERCPRCGRKAEVLGRLSDGWPAWEAVRGGLETPPQWLKEVCWCERCKRFFERGNGGTKEKMCAGCGPVQMEFAIERLVIE